MARHWTAVGRLVERVTGNSLDGRRRARGVCRKTTRPVVERLEERTMLSVSALLNFGSLDITLNGDSDALVQCVGGQVKVNGNNPDNGVASCFAVNSINVNVVTSGAGDENTIDLGNVRTSDFPSITGGDVTVNAADGADSIIGSQVADIIDGGDGADTISGQGGDDVITGGLGNDVINGNAGTDRLVESGDVNFNIGAATLTGVGSDIFGTMEQAALTGGGSANSIQNTGFAGPVTLDGGAGNDTITGGSAADNLIGGDGNDSITAGAGNDSIVGGNGNDTMDGGSGNDTINGGADDDLYLFPSGADVFLETGGIDTINFASATSGVTVILGLLTVQPVFTGTTLQLGTLGFENAIGSPFNDAITCGFGTCSLLGGAGNDTITGGSGVDTIDGGPGDDSMNGAGGGDLYIVKPGSADVVTETGSVNGNTLDFSTATLGITVNLNLSSGQVQTVDTAGNTLTISNVGFSTVIGSSFGDFITGGGTMIGGSGNDTLVGGSGPDSIDGGPGNDSLSGGSGNDTVLGGADNDMLTGVAGIDLLDGGSGSDTLLESNAGSEFVLTDATLTAQQAGQGQPPFANFTLTSIESATLTGSQFEVSGRTLPATLIGGKVISTNDANFTLTGSSLVRSTGGTFTLTSIGSLQLTGGPSANTLDVGGFAGGPVTLDGAGGDDVLTANPVFFNTLIGGPGTDRIQLTGDADFALSDSEVSFFTVPTATSTLSGVERAVLTGGAGNNSFTANGWSGIATLNGGGGSDSFSVTGDTNFIFAGPQLQLASGPAFEFQNMEQLGLVGGAGNNIFDVSGFAGAVSINALGGTDRVVATGSGNFVLTRAASTTTLDGTAAGFGTATFSNNDVEEVSLTGGAGNDSFSNVGLNGSILAVTLNGGGGTDTVTVTGFNGYSLSNTSVSNAGVPIVSLNSIEAAQLTSNAAADPWTVAGWTGTATLTGVGGAASTLVLNENANFTLTDTSLVSSLGANLTLANFGQVNLTGGASNNTFNLGSSTLSAALDGSGGTDTVTAVNSSFTLSNSLLQRGGLPNVTLTSIEQANLTGGSGDDVINAGSFSGATTLSGGIGNDSVTGGSGSDSISGGDGDDVIDDLSGTNTLDGGPGCDVVNGATEAGCGFTANFANTGGNTTVTEGSAASDTYTVTLSRKPTADVTITLAPDAQVTVSETTLTFTPDDFNVPQGVRVAAVNDLVAEGTHTGTIFHTFASADADFNTAPPANFVVNIKDNDTAGLAIVPSGGSTQFTEGDAGDTYTVALTSQPTAAVTVNLQAIGLDVNGLDALQFLAGNFSVPQTVTVFRFENPVAQGTQTGSVRHTTTSSDAMYAALAAVDLPVTIFDNDTVGVSISAAGTVSENVAANEEIFISLTSQPSADVTITITPDSQLLLNSSATLVFTSSNFSFAQSVFVTAVNDFIDETSPHTGTLAFTVSSADAAYNSLVIPNSTVNITDNDTAGVEVTAASSITEGGNSTQILVRLTSEPTSNVTITLAPDAQVTTQPGSFVFTPNNFNLFQQLTIAAVDDLIAEGDHQGHVQYSLSSGDANYNGLAVSQSTVTIFDNDTAGFEFTPASPVNEGFSDSLTVRLVTQPTADVTLTISPNSQLSTTTPTLTFTPQNFATPQTINYTAVNDTIVEGNHSGTIAYSASSQDAVYNNFAVPATTVAITDNDPIGVDILGGNGVTEGQNTNDLLIRLIGQPTADVTITLTPDAQLTLDQMTLVFTPADFNIQQLVNYAPVNDLVFEDTHSGVISYSVSSQDATYNNFTVANTTITIFDNDFAGFAFTQANPVNEGFSDSLTVRLASQPTADVTLTISPDSQLTTTPPTLTFTPQDFATPQTINYTAVNDTIVEGGHLGTIAYSASSQDAAYNNLSVPATTININDNDPAEVDFTAVRAVNEGFSDSLTLRLTTQPAADVTLTISPNSQLTTSPPTLTFTPQNFATPQTVNYTAVNDTIVEGTHLGTIAYSASSQDPGFNNFAINSPNVTIFDNDPIGVDVNFGDSVSEGGTPRIGAVRLLGQPTADVTITLAADAQLTLDRTTLVFTPANFGELQLVNYAAVDDLAIEGTHGGVISYTVSSQDATYNNFVVANSNVTIFDNDVAGIVLEHSNGETSVVEGGANDTYTVRLVSQPAADVTVNIEELLFPGNPQATLSSTSLLFTAANFNVAQTITITAIDDAAAEALSGLRLRHTASSTHLNFNGIFADIDASVLDNDTAGVTVTETGLGTAVVEGGATDSYTLVLLVAPTADVTITLIGLTRATATPAVLTFTPANFATPQTVTITAVDDNVFQGNSQQLSQHFVESSDARYNRILVERVLVTITDNDPQDTTGPKITDVRFVAAGTSIGAIDLVFDEPLAAATAGNAANYRLRGAGRDKRFGTADDTNVTFAAPAYTDATRSVRLTPTAALAANQFFQVTALGTTSITDVAGNKLDGNRDGTAGDDFIATFARGTKLAFTDRDNDKVSVKIKGGVLELIRRADGQAETLRATKTGTAASTLSGSVKRGTGGNGTAVIGAVSGVVGSGITNSLRNPPFQIGAISAAVVDLLLEERSPGELRHG